MKTPTAILRALLFLCTLFVVAAALAGCGSGGSSSSPTAGTALTVGTSYNPIPVGVATQYSSSLTVTWTSSNPSVATIDANGVALGKAAGTTTITATTVSTPIQTATSTLTVTSDTLTSIAISPTTYTFPSVGSTKQLTANGTYSNGNTYNITGVVTWTSSSTAAATVSATGLVTDVAAGSSTITATYPSTTISASMTVATQ